MNKLNQRLLKRWTDTGHTISEFSDEYHSFQDLYTQRMYLTALAFNSNPSIAWKSKEHSDDSMFPGYFIVGINTPQGQYTYHYKLEHWDLFKLPELDKAPEWDGHSSKDIARLTSISINPNTYSVYPVTADSVLLYMLDGGVQEEILCPMGHILEELIDSQEYAKFISTVDINSSDCLLTKAW